MDLDFHILAEIYVTGSVISYYGCATYFNGTVGYPYSAAAFIGHVVGILITADNTAQYLQVSLAIDGAAVIL